MGAGRLAMVCGGTTGGAPAWLGGMPLMYLLMSGFHAAPWLSLIAGRSWR